MPKSEFYDQKEWARSRALLLEELKLPKGDIDRLTYLKYTHKAVIAVRLLMEEWFNNVSIPAFEELSISDVKNITEYLIGVANNLTRFEIDTDLKINLIKLNVEGAKRWQQIERGGISGGYG